MRALLLCGLTVTAAYSQQVSGRPFRLDDLKTPPGFEVSVYATLTGAPRHMAFGPNGVLYVATRGNGSVVAIPERGRSIVAARGIPGPHTLVFRGNDLWIGANDGVYLLRDAVTPDLVIRSQSQRVVALPTGGQHTTRTLLIDNEGSLYVSAGSTCNFCNETDRRRAAITRYEADGSGQTIFALGLRNAVGLAWHPVTGELWSTDHGGDNLGDDDPPEEVNIIEEGKHYGWPDCISQQRTHRMSAAGARCAETKAPEFETQAHSAPLGISFYTGDQFPASFRNDAFVAYHGSWNRTTPAGFKVMRVRTSSGRAGEGEDFLWGFLDLNNRTRSGRPVHAISGPDGALHVSDDGNGNIYRITYHGPRINDGGIVKAADNIHALYGQRLMREGGTLRVFANGLAAEVLYAGENQINFVLPAGAIGDVTIRVENDIAADEQAIRVE